MGRTSLNPGCRERPLPGFLVGVWALSTGWGWGCQSFTCPLLSALGLPADTTQSSAAPSGIHALQSSTYRTVCSLSRNCR